MPDPETGKEKRKISTQFWLREKEELMKFLKIRVVRVKKKKRFSFFF